MFVEGELENLVVENKTLLGTGVSIYDCSFNINNIHFLYSSSSYTTETVAKLKENEGNVIKVYYLYDGLSYDPWPWLITTDSSRE